MKKIMFNDKCGLTQAVLDGIKTQTRRVINIPVGFELKESYHDLMTNKKEFLFENGNEKIIVKPKYQIGEIVAIAQSYSTISENNISEKYKGTIGYKNKMYVKSELMPNKVLITDVNVEKINDISYEDCFSEGIEKDDPDTLSSNLYYYKINGYKQSFLTPVAAFMYLLDAIGGIDIWLDNKYVFAYKFELMK